MSLRLALLLLALCLAGGCDQQQGEAVSVVEPPVEAPPPRPPLPTRGRLDTLAVLVPNRTAHLAVTPAGKIFFCQPTDDGRDLVLTIGPRDLPEPTALTSSTIADTLGDPLIAGNITALTAGPEGRLWFFFTGTQNKRRVFALGHYDPQTTRIRIFAETRQILAASGMGASIELATVRLVATPSRLWLWLRHIDESVLLSVDLSRLPSQGFAELQRPFQRVRHEEEVLEMNHPQCRLSAAGDGDDLLLVDAYTGGLFRIDPLGRARLIHTLIGLPQAMSQAAPCPEPGRLAIFAAEAVLIEPKVATRLDAASVDTNYPAFLLFEPGERLAAIPHQRLTGRLGLPIYAMRLSELFPHPGGGFIAFDAANGELMRVWLQN